MMNGVGHTGPHAGEGGTDVKYPPNVGRGLSSAELEVDKLYEPKQNKKIVRIFTVILYMFSVSLGAILLSLYYVFLWKNPHTKDIIGKTNMTAVESDLVLENFSLSPEVQQVMVDPGLKFDYDDHDDVKEDNDGDDVVDDVLAPSTFQKPARGVPPRDTRDRSFAKRNIITD